MKCPRCDSIDLAAEERHELTIDRCSRCGGVWLDHGELEKIVAFIRTFEPRHDGHTAEAHPSGTRTARGHVWEILNEAFSWLPWS